MDSMKEKLKREGTEECRCESPKLSCDLVDLSFDILSDIID